MPVTYSRSMRIRQHAYLALKSEELSPGAISMRLGMEPDEISVMGSKRQKPPVPAAHSWITTSRSAGPVDEMAAELVTRVRPCAAQIRSLVSSGAVNAVLQVVRYFGDEAGELEDQSSILIDGQIAQRIPGQHQFLGFHLDSATLQFLVDTGIQVDFDEYG